MLVALRQCGVPVGKHVERQLAFALLVHEALPVVAVLNPRQHANGRPEILQDPWRQASAIVLTGDHLDLSPIHRRLELFGPDLVVVAVLSSLYPIATVLLARFVLGERLTRVQQLGFVAAMAATALIAAG